MKGNFWLMVKGSWLVHGEWFMIKGSKERGGRVPVSQKN